MLSCSSLNPLCAGILQTNVAISLPKDSYEINQYGLGKTSEILSLHVPKHNWGGAYIECLQNSYDDKTILRKDSLREKKVENYLILDVKVRNAEQTLKDLFDKLRFQGRLMGRLKLTLKGWN